MIKQLGIVLLTFVMLIACNLGTPNSSTSTAIVIPSQTALPLNSDTFSVDEDSLYSSFPETISNHLQEIFQRGQQMGNRADVFSKIGDSITVSSNFLHPLGRGQYNLGEFTYLQDVINYYSQTTARTGNSFVNQSLAATEGWSAFAALTPNSANPQFCGAGELPLLCEYRTVRPSVALIMFGTNDAGFRSDEEFYNDMQRIVTLTEEQGIIPILSTIPNRPDVAHRVQAFNAIIRDIAASNNLPVIEYFELTISLPNFGLTSDNVHPSSPPQGSTAAANFNPINLQYGYVVRNLATLQALHLVQFYLQQ